MLEIKCYSEIEIRILFIYLNELNIGGKVGCFDTIKLSSEAHKFPVIIKTTGSKFFHCSPGQTEIGLRKLIPPKQYFEFKDEKDLLSINDVCAIGDDKGNCICKILKEDVMDLWADKKILPSDEYFDEFPERENLDIATDEFLVTDYKFLKDIYANRTDLIIKSETDNKG